VHNRIMIIDLDGKHAEHAYSVLTAIVAPRPIAWVTTLNEDGSVNAAPFSFFNCFGSKPPMVVFAPGNKNSGEPKDTARNIRRSKEFVIHMVDRDLAESMVKTSANVPAGVSELEGLGLTLAESEVIEVPRIKEAPFALECTEHSTLEIGENRLLIGCVHRVHARDGLFDPDTLRLYVDQYSPVARMAAPDWYCMTEDLYEIPRS